MPVPALTDAFDRAVAEVDDAIRAGIVETADGKPAAEHLDALRRELALGRDRAADTGRVDPEWLRLLIRGTMAWIPDSRLRIIAALGAIARAAPRGP